MGKIGNVEIKNKVILAPMAGVTNEAFFFICKKYGAGLLCSEMVSDKGILYNNEKTLSLLKFDDSLHPYSIQLFGNDPKELAEAAKIAVKLGKPDILDINMGCSVPKIFKNGSGSALLKDPNKIYEIVKEVVNAVDVPVTIKIRSGLDHKHINFIDVAKAAERAGVSAIAFHPRTKTDLFSGKADWTLLKELKENVKVPIIGSGDVKTPEDAKRMLDETGIDYVMIGRAAMGNPFIFKEINDFLDKGYYNKVTNEEKFDTLLEHFKYLKQTKNAHIAVLEMRTYAAWYVKGMMESALFKSKLNECSTEEELLDLVNRYKDKILNDKERTNKNVQQ